MTTIFYFSLICIFSGQALASGNYDDLAAKIGYFASQMDCQKIGSSRAESYQQNSQACTKVMHESFSSDLTKINQQIIFQRLAIEESKALDCSIERWGGLAVKTETDPVIEDIKRRIDVEVPELKALQESINKFSAANMNPTLSVKNDKTLAPADKIKKLVEVKQAFDAELLKLQEAYNLHLAKIPLSNHPLMRNYIESKFSSAFNTTKPAMPFEIKKVIAAVNSTFQTDKAELNKSKIESKFGSKLEDKLISNPEHIQALIRETPILAPSLFKLQCDIENRAKGKFIVEAGVSGLTFAIGGSAIALARASRLAVIASDVEGALTVANWARSLTYVASTLGTAQSMEYVIKKCTRDIKVSKASCKASLESFKEDEQMVSCLKAGTFAAGLILAPKLFNVFKQNSEWAKYLERQLARQTTAATTVEISRAPSAALANFISIEGKIAGETRRFQAEIISREIGKNGLQSFKIISTNPETGKKTSGVLTESQLFSLKPQNLVAEKSNSAPGIEVREFEDAQIWQQYFQNETTLGIKYAPESTEGLNIIRRSNTK